MGSAAQPPASLAPPDNTPALEPWSENLKLGCTSDNPIDISRACNCVMPPLHIALLKASAVFDNLHEAMHTQRWSEGLPTNALLISGPSKTADIQQTLAYGAHGPKELIVLILQDA